MIACPLVCCTQRIYDPADPEKASIAGVISRWTNFFKAQRDPRPSGAPGLLVSKMIHLLRPSARDLEACVHVTPDASSPQRALLALINPTRRALKRNVTVPLWYTGLPPGTKLQLAPLPLRGGAPSAAEPSPFASGQGSETHVLGADGTAAGLTDAVVEVQLGPASYALLVGTVAKA